MKFKKKLIITVSVILVVAIVALCFIVFKPKKSVDYGILDKKVTATPKYIDAVLPEGNTIVLGEVGGRQLSYVRDINAFYVTDTATGFVFTSGSTLADYTLLGDATEDKNRFTICQVGYTNFNGLQDVTSTSSTKVNITEKTLQNGIALELDFTNFDFSFTVEIWLTETGLKALIPFESIKESGAYGITSITLFPNMGSVKNSENGFIIYPDGSGSYYKLGQSHNTSPLSTYFYFENSFSLDDIEQNIYQGVQNVMLPSFAISDGKSGIVGYVTDGDANAYVTLQPAFSDSGFNMISPSCLYRKTYSYLSPADVRIIAVEKSFSAGDFGVEYFFVGGNGEAVSYGKIAGAVREFMLSNGLLNKVDNKGEIQANLQLIMSTKGNSGMDTSLKVLTEFNHVEKIINKIPKTYRDKLRIYMLGWQQGGFGLNPSGDKISGKLGNKDDLITLNTYLKNESIDSYMVADYVYAINGGIGFNANAQAVYNEMNLPITNSDYTEYLRNGLVEISKFIKTRLPYFKDVKANGIAFDKFGNYLYDDYSKGGKVSRTQTAQAFLKTAKLAKDEAINVAVQGGNAYMLSVADTIYDMPESSSGHTAMAYSIPFYQMVVHGSLPYTGNIAGNMAADYQKQKLKWIEYGSQPNFVLTYNSSELIKNTYADMTFATDYKEHMDTINACLEEFNTKLKFTANETMSEHKVISDDVVSVTYESGKTIYINYNEEPVNVNGIEIPAKDYIIAEGGNAQ